MSAPKMMVMMRRAKAMKAEAATDAPTSAAAVAAPVKTECGGGEQLSMVQRLFGRSRAGPAAPPPRAARPAQKQVVKATAAKSAPPLPSAGAAAEVGAAPATAADPTPPAPAVASPVAALKFKEEASNPPGRMADGSSWLVKDKPTYDKFYYRLGNNQIIADLWKDTQLKGEDEQRAFVNSVILSKAGTVPAALLQRVRAISNEKEGNTTGEWMTFKAAADRDGGQLIRERIAHGTVITRPNPEPPPSTQIEHPWNLEVACVKEGWSKKVKEQDEESGATKEFCEKFSTTWNGVGTQSSSPTLPANPRVDAQHPQKDPPSEGDKVAVANARKVHSSFDKTAREWQGLLARSEANPYTKGAKFQTDLQDKLGVCKQLDSKVMALEMQLLSRIPLTDSEIKQAGFDANGLVEEMKEGKKIAAKIKAWLED
ncbi:unnamed protein product [Prorocentrum cordatum]|uniref:Uncharacterized protein n=1 Tax=Prorocentrum cordatum TaxID=2364126 RepID=A0ABN9SGL0_9DINO|nr:unnamed protein product [Polarella glacialis]